MDRKNLVVIAVVVVVIIAAAVWYAVGQKPAAPAAPAAEGLGADLYSEVAPNAAESLPETNPFSKEANPFKAVQTNPFEQ